MDLFDNVNNVFGCVKDVCQGVQDVTKITQNAYNNIQDVSRRTLNWNQQQQPQCYQETNTYPPGAPPVTFTPYPGFWDENYGK